ncbi:hypothetical protein V6N11_033424 [Hibiscus sabdariffa]|uniref:Uncharacterized protein n=1 Tax=Hibiscus sabdariffa TaxID=183260 RepID=A0ABR2PY16_9ROSI
MITRCSMKTDEESNGLDNTNGSMLEDDSAKVLLELPDDKALYFEGCDDVTKGLLNLSPVQGMELSSLMEDEKIVQIFLEMDEGHQTCQFKQLESTIEHTDERGGIEIYREVCKHNEGWTQLLVKELSNGRTCATSINSERVCSHSVFTCVIESWCKGVTDGVLPSDEFMEEELASLFFTTRWEYDHKTVLLVVPGDVDAIRCKVVVLKADKIDDAFSVIQYAPKEMDQAREHVSILLETFPDSVMPILFQAAVLVRENRQGKLKEFWVNLLRYLLKILHAAEASMQEFEANMAVLGKEADVAFTSVEAQPQYWLSNE